MKIAQHSAVNNRKHNWLKETIISMLAGGDIRQKLEFHHVHLELGALGYIETFLFYWSWGFFQKKTPPRPIFVFENTRDLKNIFFKNSVLDSLIPLTILLATILALYLYPPD